MVGLLGGADSCTRFAGCQARIGSNHPPAMPKPKQRPQTKPRTDSMAGPRGKTGKTGRTGKTGATGATGPIGPAGADHTQAISLLSEQVATLVRELQTQLVRIGQIQVQLDALAS